MDDTSALLAGVPQPPRRFTCLVLYSPALALLEPLSPLKRDSVGLGVRIGVGVRVRDRVRAVVTSL
jgi:hypothetical protein